MVMRGGGDILAPRNEGKSRPVGVLYVKGASPQASCVGRRLGWSSKLGCGAPSSLSGGEHANTSAPHFHEADPEALGCEQHPDLP
jgi:hypothetical protein